MFRGINKKGIEAVHHKSVRLRAFRAWVSMCMKPPLIHSTFNLLNCTETSLMYCFDWDLYC
jgi:hypothetical protein